jgi:hypothetical protein
MGKQGKFRCLPSTVLKDLEVALLRDPKLLYEPRRLAHMLRVGGRSTARYRIREMRCELVTPRSSSWCACLSQVRHDFYHLPEYAELSAESHRDALARAFVARDDNDVFLVPLILRPIEGLEERYTLFDTTGPYGYGSPIVSTTSAAFMGRAIEAMIELLRQEYVVTLFSRASPVVDPFRAAATVRHGRGSRRHRLL